VFACDTRGVDYQPDYEWPEGEFEVQIAMLDTLYADVSRSKFTTSLSADSSAIYRTTYPMISSYDVRLPPGNALASVSIRSESNGAVGFSSKPVRIREFGDSLQVSDIELRFAPEGPVNASHVYLWRGYAHLAFDIYNLITDRVGTGRAEVGYRITRVRESVSIARRMMDLLGFASAAELSGGIASLESRYELRSVGPDKSETIGIDLAPLSKGRYLVEVTVTDLLSGKVTSVTTDFRIASELQP
jgi:hypothetical protein